MPKIRIFLVLGLLIVGAALATRGTSDPTVNLDSLGELWSDTLRDTDQIGMKVTRVSDADEMKSGAELAGTMSESSPQNHAAEAYISAVGETVAQHVRRHGIHYQFHLVDSPAINAFALPGGQIFVTTGMLNFVESEAELAAVLGHEVSHVDLRHCIERYQYEIKLKKAGMPEAGWIVELAHHLATFSFAPYQELEADAQGERLSIEATYDPDAAAALFVRMKAHLGEPSRTPATTPSSEIAQSLGEMMSAYFRSHPPTEERAHKLENMVARHGSSLKGLSFYVGKENVRDQVPKSQRQYPGEYRRF
jgi:predicted Zn-dependent protease